MFTFPDEAALKRKGVQELLNCLPDDFPGIQAARLALANGLQPTPILRLAWECFGEQRRQESSRITSLQLELQQAWNALDMHLKDPISMELRCTKAALLEKTALVESLERNRGFLLESLERDRQLAEQEISRLKSLIVDQNRVIARQQLRFEKLTGEKSAE